jgi:hypothetical protein
LLTLGVAAPQPAGPRWGGQGDGPAEQLVEQQTQGVHVGATVHRGRDGTAGTRRRQGGLLLRGEDVGCAADPAPCLRSRGEGLAGQVEIQQHGLGLGRQQHVSGLDVEVDQGALVRVLQCVGEARHDPARRVRKRGALQEAAHAAGEVGRPPRPLEGAQEVAPRSPRRRSGGQRAQQLGKRQAAHVGHAQRPQALAGERLDEVQGHDVRVLQAQRARVERARVLRDLARVTRAYEEELRQMDRQWAQARAEADRALDAWDRAQRLRSAGAVP